MLRENIVIKCSCQEVSAKKGHRFKYISRWHSLNYTLQTKQYSLQRAITFHTFPLQ